LEDLFLAWWRRDFLRFWAFFEGGPEKRCVFNVVIDGEFVEITRKSVVLMCMVFADEKYAMFKKYFCGNVLRPRLILS
jgi:hypothetical protein